MQPSTTASPSENSLLSLQTWLRKASPRGVAAHVEPRGNVVGRGAHSAHTHDHTSRKLDVLIPCALGEKRPAFKYKDGLLWSWDNFDEMMREPGAPQEPVQGTKDLPQVDWAIVLRDLCVIDCDTPEVSCAGLEVSTRPDDRQPPLPRPRRTASLSSKPRSKPRAHLPPHQPRPKPSPTPV